MKKANFSMQTLISCFLFTCLIFLTSMTNSSITMAKALEIPKIISFTASSTNISYGDTVVLEWDVEGAVTVTIAGLEKSSEEMVPLGGSLKVQLTETTNFVLVATGTSGYKVCHSIKVYVSEKPQITSFTSTHRSIDKATLVTLKWTTANATRCKIVTADGQELLIRPANGQVSITPNKTNTYTLIAYNGDFTDKRSITITVK